MRTFPFQPVMVSGLMRSGTTVLQFLLCRSTGSAIQSEFEVIRQQCFNHDLMLGGYTNEEKRLIWSDVLRNSITMAAARLPRSNFFIMKDPLLLDVAERAVYLVPELKILCTMRDPRATLASILTVRQKQANAQQKTMLTDRSVAEVIDYVDEQLRALTGLARHANCLLVRYEDMVRRDRNVASRISNFLDIQFSFQMPEVAGQGTFDKNSPFYSPLYEKQLSADRVDAHRQLDADTLRYAQSKFSWFLTSQSYLS